MKKNLVVIQCYHERNVSTQQVNGNKNSVRERVQSIDSLRRGQAPLPNANHSENSGSPTWSPKHSFDQSSLTSSRSSTGVYGHPPPCPTPDYDSSSLASSMSVTSSSDSSKYMKDTQSGETIRTNGLPNKTSYMNGSAGPDTNSAAAKNFASNKVSSGNGTVILQKNFLSNAQPSNSLTSKVNPAADVSGSAKPVNSSAVIQNKVRGGRSNDGVEMESLESFELTNPQNPEPKPPETYFPRRQQLSSTTSSPKSTLSTASTSTVGRKPRPVSVTIGEYPSGTTRREPSKFTFLGRTDQTDSAGGPAVDLQSELARTLNRSDLKRRTEQQDANVNGSLVRNSISNGVNSPPPPPPAKGTVTVSVNNAPLKATPVKLFDGNGGTVLPTAAPGIRSVAEKLNGTAGGTSSGNRVTIRVGSEPSVQQ